MDLYFNMFRDATLATIRSQWTANRILAVVKQFSGREPVAKAEGREGSSVAVRKIERSSSRFS